MKIFIIDPNNDVAQLNYPLSESLIEKKKHDVTLITSFNLFHSRYYHGNYNANPLYLFFLFENKISNKSIRSFIKSLTYPFYNIVLLLKIFLKRPHVIHYNWLLLPPVDFIMIKLLRLFGKNVIVTQHNFTPHSKNKLRLGEYGIFTLADKIICLSEYVMSLFDKKFLPKLVHIPHGNCYGKEIDSFFKNRNDSNLNQNYDFQILFIGIIKPYKGIDLLLDTVPLLINRFNQKNFKIVIRGHCSQRDEERYLSIINQANIESNVDFENKYLTNSEICEYIKICDMGVIPYLEASQSGIPYLFYLFNKPLVLTNVGGLPEQANNKISVLTQPDAKSLANGIVKLKKRIKNGEILASNFDDELSMVKWDTIIDLYNQHYAEFNYDVGRNKR